MNPFIYGNIVTGEHFYDRNEAQTHLEQVVRHGNNIVISAPRRYGKSSLIMTVLNKLKAQGFRTLYFDFMSVISLENFIENYSAEIYRTYDNKGLDFLKKISSYLRGIIPNIGFDNMGNPTFSLQWIEGTDKKLSIADVLDLPQKLSDSQNKWVIAFDEFQEIENLKIENFEKIMRSKIHHHTNISYIFSGSRTHLLNDMFSNKNRAFYNSASLMKLPKIDEIESIKYLSENFAKYSIEISEENCRLIIQKASNIPYYIQFLAAEIWQKIILDTKPVNEGLINSAVEKILNIKSDYYWEMFNKNTNIQKTILKVVASEEHEIFSGKIIHKYGLKSPATIQTSLKKFINDGIIEKFDNSYEFTDPFLKLFIQRKIS